MLWRHSLADNCCNVVIFLFFCLLSRFVHALHRETMTPNRHDHNPHDRFLQRGSKKRVMELFSIYSAGWTLQSVYETTPRYTHTRTHTHNSIKKKNHMNIAILTNIIFVFPPHLLRPHWEVVAWLFSCALPKIRTAEASEAFLAT